MASEPIPTASFSARRKWSILLSVALSVAAVAALVIMANYLGSRYFLRFAWSAEARMELSPRTIGLLKSLTNEVKVVVYYDKKAPLYDAVSSLLKAYKDASPRISIETVDYQLDPAAAQKVKTKYGLATSEDKNLVIFESNGRKLVVQEKILGSYTLERVAGGKENEMRQKLLAFKGEMFFSSAILTVTSTKPLKACFLVGHGEHDPREQKEVGYSKFTTLLFQNNYVQPQLLQLLGTNGVPNDCNLLIIAGPTQQFEETELQKIKQYLDQGGRLLMLFNSFARKTDLGLESLLANWGVDVGHNRIKDPENTTVSTGEDVIVSNFDPHHPVVNSLLGSRLQLFEPRSIGKLSTLKDTPTAPKVDELAFTGNKAIINTDLLPVGHPVPLMVAVEKGAVQNVYADRGTTRIVVVGDSLFLDNQVIDVEGNSNSDFADRLINWLLDRTQLLQGIGQRPVKEYRVLMTRSELQSVQWLFLAGMPGGILMFGGLVWLRRRH